MTDLNKEHSDLRLDIPALRKLIEQATPLPWNECGCGKCGIVFGDGGRVYIHLPPNVEDIDPVPVLETKLHNSSYLVAAANSLPQALDEIERLRDDNARLHAMAEKAKNILGNVEWIRVDGIRTCPWCGRKARLTEERHAPDCPRQQALAKLEEVLT